MHTHIHTIRLIFLRQVELWEFLWSFVDKSSLYLSYMRVFMCVSLSLQWSWKITCRASWTRPTLSTARGSSRWSAMTSRKDWSGPESVGGGLPQLQSSLCLTHMWSSTLDGEQLAVVTILCNFRSVCSKKLKLHQSATHKAWKVKWDKKKKRWQWRNQLQLFCA